MAIFISYSQKDSDFVDTLAANLVIAKHHVWMDRWELNVGDSLTQKIEATLTESSAILVIIERDRPRSASSRVESALSSRMVCRNTLRRRSESLTAASSAPKRPERSMFEDPAVILANAIGSDLVLFGVAQTLR